MVKIGPPVDPEQDEEIVSSFMALDGKKVICGGTTSQIVAKVIGKEIHTSLNYQNPSILPTAEIEGISLTTEGVLTLRRALEYIKACESSENTMQDFINLNKKDGASKLAKTLLEEGTNIHFKNLTILIWQ